MLDLAQIDNASEDDKYYGIDHWARLFRARTWDDLNMLAKENPLMAEANDTIHRLTEASNFVDACMRREEELARESYMKHKIEELTFENEELKRQLAAEQAKNNK